MKLRVRVEMNLEIDLEVKVNVCGSKFGDRLESQIGSREGDGDGDGKRGRDRDRDRDRDRGRGRDRDRNRSGSVIGSGGEMKVNWKRFKRPDVVDNIIGVYVGRSGRTSCVDD